MGVGMVFAVKKAKERADKLIATLEEQGRKRPIALTAWRAGEDGERLVLL